MDFVFVRVISWIVGSGDRKLHAAKSVVPWFGILYATSVFFVSLW